MAVVSASALGARPAAACVRFAPETHRLPDAYAEAGSALFPTRTPRLRGAGLGEKGLEALANGRVGGWMAGDLWTRSGHESPGQPAAESGRLMGAR